MAFENRVVEHANRKQLSIISDVTTNGKRVILADVERAEGTVSKTGTPLTAESLTAQVKEIVGNTSTSSNGKAVTQCECDSSTNIATTEFVWKVLKALNHNYVNHDHSGGGQET